VIAFGKRKSLYSSDDEDEEDEDEEEEPEATNNG
jgi:hypothetical protein